MHECVLCAGEHRRGSVAQLRCDGEGATDAIVDRCGEPLGEAGGDPADVCAVPRAEHTADEGDTEGAAELADGVVQRRCDALAFLGQ